jgi:hypothetical protein
MEGNAAYNFMYVIGEYPCSTWNPWPQQVGVICASVTVQGGGFDQGCAVLDLLIKWWVNKRIFV